MPGPSVNERLSSGSSERRNGKKRRRSRVFKVTGLWSVTGTETANVEIVLLNIFNSTKPGFSI